MLNSVVILGDSDFLLHTMDASTGKSNDDTIVEIKDYKALKGAPGLANIDNVNKASGPMQPMKPNVGAQENVSVVPIPDKENSVAISKTSEATLDISGAAQDVTSKPNKKPPDQQFGALQGRLKALQRETLRPTVSAATGASLSSRPTAHDAIAARLESLRNETHRSASTAVAPPVSTINPPPQPAATTAAHPAATIPTAPPSSTSTAPAPPVALTSLLPQHVQFEPAGQMDPSQPVSRLAIQLFEDRAFLELCDRGMHAQLTRTKDGATDETKIKELAGIVKTLRRGMKELQVKTQSFIDASVRHEKEAIQQVEAVKLAGESMSMAAQAELAKARKESAAAAAAHKNALASWQAEIDIHKSEVNRLKRDVERLESERERAREDARRADSSRSTIEAELKEMKKAVGQQVRELQVDKNSTQQALKQMQEVADKERTELREALSTMEARATEAEATCASLNTKADNLALEKSKLEQQLGEVSAWKDQLQKELVTLKEEYAAHQSLHEKAKNDSASLVSEVEGWQSKATALLAELEAERAGRAADVEAAAAAALAAATSAAEAQEELQQAKKQAEEAHKEAIKAHQQAVEVWEAEKATWAAQCADLEANQSAVSARETALSEEKVALQSALEEAQLKMTEVELQLQESIQQLESVKEEYQGKQADFNAMNDTIAQLEEKARAAVIALEEEQDKRVAIIKDVDEKQKQLEKVEAELEALQECTIGGMDAEGDEKEMLTRMLHRITSLEAALVAAEARRREVHNQLVEMKGNIRVFARVRPSPKSIVTCLPDGSSIRVAAEGKEHVFSYDRVFRPKDTQSRIFEEVSDLVQSALDGYKVCLFSYGQTGAGKTHTMQGGRSYESQGIIPRSISKILETVARLREQGWEYVLEASFIEVYNETLRDLLAGGAHGGKISETLSIQHSADGGHTTVVGAVKATIVNDEDAANIIKQAAAARACESTAMNATSSRSHSVFMLYITGRHENSGALLQGSLNLVDLAGSERLNRSQAEGARQKETCAINKSLSALGDIFAALHSKSSHIPYRNSKLTHLLQPCLGGSGKTLMFVNINPEPESGGESLCSLRFAAKVNACETAASKGGGASRNLSSSSIANHDINSSLGGGGGGGVPARKMVTDCGNDDGDGGGGRRASTIPSFGGAGNNNNNNKRKAGIPLPPSGRQLPRPRNQ